MPLYCVGRYLEFGEIFRLCYLAQAKACTPNPGVASSSRPLRLRGESAPGIYHEGAKSAKDLSEQNPFQTRGLSLPERLSRIDTRGATRREVTCYQRHDDQGARHQGENRRITGADVEEHSFENPCQPQRPDYPKSDASHNGR